LALYALVDRALALGPSWPNQDLVDLAWGLGKAGYQTAAVRRLLGAAVAQLAPARTGPAGDAAPPPPPPASLAQLVALLWACARCGFSSPQLGGALLPAICSHAESARESQIANVAWACARLRLGDARALQWVADQSQAQWGALRPQALANTAWGLWKQGYQPTPAFLGGLVSASSADWSAFKPAELSSLLFALAKWRASLAGGQLAALERQLAAQAGQLDGFALCSLTWALVRWVLGGGGGGVAWLGFACPEQPLCLRSPAAGIR
jgi:hypothetical protein